MFRRSLLVALLIVTILAPSLTYGRYYSSRYHHRGRGGYGGGGANSIGSIIRAQGAYNQMTAQAMLTVQKAKSAALDNKLKAAQTYYQLHRSNEQMKAEQARERLSIYAAAPPVKIPRLTSSQLDPVTGQLTWPPLLMGPEFDTYRASLERLFADRAIDASRVTNTQVISLVHPMRDKLDGEHDQVSISDFFTARHFLDAMEHESQYTGLEDHPGVAAIGN